MNDKKQIDKQAIAEMRKDLIEIFDEEYEKRRLITADFTAIKMSAKGYRKQSENTIEIETVKKWLYEMAINNVGCYLEGDFATACEQIISRLDGLKRFAEEMKGGAG